MSSLLAPGQNGEVAERLKALASKARNGVPSFVGSNPTLSATVPSFSVARVPLP